VTCLYYNLPRTQENAVFPFFFFLLFVLFSLLASKKSSNTRKYRLLIKRNTLYFLGAFFSSFGEIGLAFHGSTLLWKKLKILPFHLLVSRSVANYPVLGLHFEMIYFC
jgi:hypothetical protein